MNLDVVYTYKLLPAVSVATSVKCIRHAYACAE